MNSSVARCPTNRSASRERAIRRSFLSVTPTTHAGPKDFVAITRPI
jgi:hypothetical protein